MIGAILPRVRDVRRIGSAALDLAWVAAGRFDGFWERDLKAWDIAAGLILVREAGGFASSADGGPDALAARSGACGNEGLHRDLIAYGEILGQEAGQGPIEPKKLVVPMLERFIATDRGFATARRSPRHGSGSPRARARPRGRNHWARTDAYAG